jgi:prepilin-type N-terminal cleavage/methylation domain-containing protein
MNNHQPLTMNHQPPKTGFTLVEMLVVIAILSILMAMMVPAAGMILRRAKLSTAKGDAGVVVTVLLKYQAEYNRWPGFYGTTPGEENLTDKVWVDAMSPPPRQDGDPPSKYNFKHIVFFEPGSKTLAPTDDPNAGAFVDPWGTPFRYQLDIDGDGQCAHPNPDVGGDIPFRAIAWSAGPDHDHTTWDDNAMSWE